MRHVDPEPGGALRTGGAEHTGRAAGGTATGGSAPGLVDAACGYWDRRGMPTSPAQVVTAPGAPLLLLALLGAVGGGVLLPKPCAEWYAPQIRLLARAHRAVGAPPESGGVPDPFALQEAVARLRDDGGDPRALLLSVVDDPTGTAPAPELLREVCEVAAAERLLVVSDESWRDSFHRPHGTVVVSPAEILPPAAPVVLLMALDAMLLPPVGPTAVRRPAAIARFPADERGRASATEVRDSLGALRTALAAPVAEAAAQVLTEPPPLRERRAAEARRQGALAAALCRAVTDAGGLCRPPHAGRHLYVDLEPLRATLAARGITDAAALEARLTVRLGPAVAGGHRFGDDPKALRVRLGTELLTGRAAPHPDAPGDPLDRPGTAEALRSVRAALAELIGRTPHTGPTAPAGRTPRAPSSDGTAQAHRDRTAGDEPAGHSARTGRTGRTGDTGPTAHPGCTERTRSTAHPGSPHGETPQPDDGSPF